MVGNGVQWAVCRREGAGAGVGCLFRLDKDLFGFSLLLSSFVHPSFVWSVWTKIFQLFTSFPFSFLPLSILLVSVQVGQITFGFSLSFPSG